MQRKHYSSDLKARIVIEAIREQRTLNELAKEYGPHPVQISKWKKQVLDALPGLFSDRSARVEADHAALEARLYQQIGQLQMEVDWLKKGLRSSRVK